MKRNPKTIIFLWILVLTELWTFNLWALSPAGYAVSPRLRSLGSKNSSVSVYGLGGVLRCSLPADARYELDPNANHRGTYLKVRIPDEYQNHCGASGWVHRSATLSGRSLKSSRERSIREINPQELVDSDADLNFESKDNDIAIDIDIENNADNEIEDFNQETEAMDGSQCAECEKESSALAWGEIGQKTYESSYKPMCEAKGYRKVKQKKITKENIHEVIESYSQRARGAVHRAFLSLVPPKGTPSYQRLKTLTKNFSDFESVDPLLLKSLLRKQHRDCYKFVKAALSNDYSVLKKYQTTRKDFRRPTVQANLELVKNFCGTRRGDLTEAHWQNANVSAGTAGPQLEARGYVNLLDSRYGVAREFRSDLKAPFGAVLVYKCMSRGRILPAAQCDGDISMKSNAGFLRDFFTPYSITTTGRRVLTGVYIQPGEA